MQARVSRQGPTIAAPIQSEPPRVLVVEPDDDVRLSYRGALEAAGCDVLEAVDGREALAKALVRVPSLVVTELQLPFVDGTALCEILKKDRTTAAVPILIITGETRPETIERARRLANAVLAKPAGADSMLSECTRLLGRSDAPGAAVPGKPGGAVPSTAGSTGTHRPVLVKSLPRFTTTTPPSAPPALTCPACGRPLRYDHSHVGGVSERHREQWDYYSCANCGSFQYRQRTRRLRRAD
jgi:CheY-like chemotaxis protein